MPLFVLGSVVIDSPGPFNVSEVAEEFGADYAVKPLVGAMQDREFMGPADNHLTLSGTLYPDFYARAGHATGLDEIAQLRKMIARGSSQPLVRGGTNATNLGYWLVEKVSTRSSKLAANGVGKVVTFDISLVRTDRKPDPDDMKGTLSYLTDSLIHIYG